MSTSRKSIQSRWNGSRSKGAATETGKHISSQAPITHGLTSRHDILATEDPAAYQRHLDLFLTHFQPANPFETHILTQLAVIDWKLLRAGIIETTLLDLEIDESASSIADTYSEIDRPAVWALAFRSLTERTNTFHNINWHQSRLSRQYFRAFDYFCKLRKSIAPEKAPTGK